MIASSLSESKVIVLAKRVLIEVNQEAASLGILFPYIGVALADNCFHFSWSLVIGALGSKTRTRRDTCLEANVSAGKGARKVQ